MSQGEETPKIQIDSDWKSQAQREKQRLAEQEAQKKAATGPAGGAAVGGHEELPPASFETLMSVLISQAMMYLGGFADPRTGRAMVDLDAGRFHIDLLGVLEEKTKGNLTDEEAKLLATAQYELRMRYVQLAQAVTGIGTGGPGPGPGAVRPGG